MATTLIVIAIYSAEDVTRGAIREPTYLCLILSQDNIISALKIARINITSIHIPKQSAPMFWLVLI